MTSEYIERLDEIVINAETNDYRFERFCIAVVAHIEGGVAVSGTSTSWDLGRDGVGYGRGSGIYICTSLRNDVDIKALSDVERITETTTDIRKLYFCSSQNLSENKRDQMKAALHAEVSRAFEIVVLGAQQLAEFGRLEKTALERHYGAEVSNVLARISGRPDDQTELKGLRLALLSHGSDESVAIRNSIYSSAILDLLSDEVSRTPQTMCNQISAQLRLGHSLDVAVISPHLAALAQGGFLSNKNELYAITAAGLAQINDRKLSAATSLVSGRNVIRSELEAAIGSKIIDDEYFRIWDVFESKMSEYFQSRGEQIVSEVATVLGEDGNSVGVSGDRQPAFSFLDDFASAVAATSSHSERQQELQIAIKDLFSDRSGNATEWLVKLCAAFVAACTMGLEYKTAQAVKSLLQRISLVLDTDVVLSLLGDAESDHEAVETIVTRWARLGGVVLVGTPVLEEAAYHAHIAQRDYEQIKGLDLSDKKTRFQLIENVFVRSFARLVAAGEARIGQWRQYIDQFRGAEEYDYSKLSAHLQLEHSIQRLPDRDAEDFGVVTNVKNYILEQMEGQSLRMDRRLRDKATRDAELYVAIATHTTKIRASDPGSACLLISSAKRLTSVDQKFRLSGEARLVVSIATGLYLISMLPNVSLGLTSMRAFLFDEHRTRFSSELERTLLRMIQASNEFSMPFAKRAGLMREVRGRLLQGASRADGTPAIDAVEKRALKEENREELVRVLTESLDAVAVDTRSEKEIRDLKSQVAALQRRLDAQKGIQKKRGKQ